MRRGADLVNAEIDLQAVVVRVAELYGELAAGAAATIEVNLGAGGFQVLPRPEHFVQIADLKGHMVQLDITRRPIQPADQRQAMVIGAEAQEHHAAGHHLLAIDVRDLHPQHIDVEVDGAGEVCHLQHHMADFADTEGHAVRALAGGDRTGIEGHNFYSAACLT